MSYDSLQSLQREHEDTLGYYKELVANEEWTQAADTRYYLQELADDIAQWDAMEQGESLPCGYNVCAICIGHIDYCMGHGGLN